MNKIACGLATFAVVTVATLQSALGAIPEATYLFDDTLDAEEPGAPSLIAVDPLGANGFLTTTVFGDTRRVYEFDGAVDPPEDQGGLTLDTTGLVTPNDYSVEIIALWYDRGTSPGAEGWRHITDVEDRTSDSGFYINPSDALEFYAVASGSSTTYGIGEFHHVVLTVSSSTDVRAYLDGGLEIDADTTLADIDNAGNPDLLMHFFLDDTTSGFVNDWAAGQVALIRLWDGVLTPGQVAALASDPFNPIPEPGGFLLLCFGGLGAGTLANRRYRRTSA